MVRGRENRARRGSVRQGIAGGEGKAQQGRVAQNKGSGKTRKGKGVKGAQGKGKVRQDIGGYGFVG